MILQFYKPSVPLGNFIETFIYYKGYQPEHQLERLLPDGQVNLVFNLLNESQFIYDNESLKAIQACNKTWFSGLRTKYITIPSGKNSEMLVVNFLKGKAYPFLEMPMQEMTDYVVESELIFNRRILELRDDIISLNAVPQKFQYLENKLYEWFQHRLLANPCIDFAVNTILQTPQFVTMNELNAKIGYSQKHFIQMFKEHVGVNPKQFLKIARFQYALSRIESGTDPDWSGLAFNSGYYDQAHFINEFKLYSGHTPHQYWSKHWDFLNYLPLE